MEFSKYLLIENPTERITATSERMSELRDEIQQLTKIRTGAIIEAYEARIHPKEICKLGGFNNSRLRQLFHKAGYTPPFNYTENSKATQYKDSYEN